MTQPWKRTRSLAALLVLVACASTLGTLHVGVPSGPVPMLERDGQGLALSVTAYRQLAHMVERSIKDRIEPAACVAPNGYRVFNGAEDTAHVLNRKVDIYALTVADVWKADSGTIIAHGGQLCDDSLPTIHGHVIGGGPWLYTPSPIDNASASRRRAPFNVLIWPAYDQVTDSTFAFGVRLYWAR